MGDVRSSRSIKGVCVCLFLLVSSIIPSSGFSGTDSDKTPVLTKKAPKRTDPESQFLYAIRPNISGADYEDMVITLGEFHSISIQISLYEYSTTKEKLKIDYSLKDIKDKILSHQEYWKKIGIEYGKGRYGWRAVQEKSEKLLQRVGAIELAERDALVAKRHEEHLARRAWKRTLFPVVASAIKVPQVSTNQGTSQTNEKPQSTELKLPNIFASPTRSRQEIAPDEGAWEKVQENLKLLKLKMARKVKQRSLE